MLRFTSNGMVSLARVADILRVAGEFAGDFRPPSKLSTSFSIESKIIFVVEAVRLIPERFCCFDDLFDERFGGPAPGFAVSESMLSLSTINLM